MTGWFGQLKVKLGKLVYCGNFPGDDNLLLENRIMITEDSLKSYLKGLLNGNRHECRQVIESRLKEGIPANMVYLEMIWPIMVEVEKLGREDRITPAQENLATRVNRTIVDQLQNKLPRRPVKNKRVVVTCAAGESRELGAQIMADLFESDGWDVKFLGGGLTNDDLLAFVNEYGPDVLLIYGTTPKQAPGIRRLIDHIRGVDAWPDMKIMVSGGLFNRAEGLWEEMGADMFAASAQQAVEVAREAMSGESWCEDVGEERGRDRQESDRVGRGRLGQSSRFGGVNREIAVKFRHSL